MKESKYSFSIDSKGVFSFQTNYTPSQSDEIGKMNSYCMEHTIVESWNMNGYYVFKCFDDVDPDEKFYYTGYAFILSSVALVLTMAVYILLNEVKKVFGKVLCLYCVTMLALSNTLAYNSFVDVSNAQCKITGEIFI